MDDDILKKIRALIANHEGRRKRVYLDTEGHPTVGIGFNLDRTDARVRLAALGIDYDGVRGGSVDLTDDQVDALFSGDVDSAVASARLVVESFDGLASNAQMVLVDMVFNLGRGGLANFRHMIAALNTGDYELAAREMKNSHWFTQVPVRAKENIAMMERASAPDESTPSSESTGVA
jgi:GH24 family phage-related lysozyme (muramidase)